MTPERYLLAMILFHTTTLGIAWALAARWWRPERAALPARRWTRSLVIDVITASVATYAVSLLATTAVNLDYGRRVYLAEISGRLMGQALFGEAILLAAALAVAHRRIGQHTRAAAFGLCALSLTAVYLDAYRVEPRMLKVRNHVVNADVRDSAPIRILHLTDIQTPAIGAHEERALRAGLASHPDLIVLTGDYVQDALGRPTEEDAARDLRALMARIRFDAPLGVYATEGDVGPSCREVFAGTPVRCLVDASTVVKLPDGDTLGITGLSRGRGRERDPAWLAWLLSKGPGADHRIVISHSPDFVDAMPVGVDLVLAGHTHGGQFVLPFFGPVVTASRLPRLFAGGLHDFRGTPLHVSRGVGMERGFSPPVRFLCPPEICVLDLRLSRSARLARSGTSS
jgi:predicted MPP superfamily phosphohydrolase